MRVEAAEWNPLAYGAPPVTSHGPLTQRFLKSPPPEPPNPAKGRGKDKKSDPKTQQAATPPLPKLPTSVGDAASMVKNHMQQKVRDHVTPVSSEWDRLQQARRQRRQPPTPTQDEPNEDTPDTPPPAGRTEPGTEEVNQW